MSRMIPGDKSREDFNDSLGEERAFDAMEGLPDDYVVLHSVGWNRSRRNGRVIWGESDYVVIVPNRGILVVEIKDGDISLRDGTWVQKNRLNGEEYLLERSPMLQAKYGKYAFLEMMQESEFEYVREMPIEPVVWFTSLDDLGAVGHLPPDCSDKTVFTAKSFNDLQGCIEGAFSYYGITGGKSYNKKELNELIDIFAPSLNIVQSMVGAAEEQDYVFHRLTNEQNYLLDYLEEQRVAAIQGGGGTGKTMLALEKARRLADGGEEVLFLCFNNMLLDYFRNYCKTQIGMENISFYNLYGLCKKYTQDDEINEAKIAEFLNDYDKYNWKYRHIIVDEGQDFSNEQLMLLNTIADLQDGCFYVFFDKNQLVQRYDVNTWFNEVDCRMVLSRNCRNTLNIAKTSYRALGIEKIRMGKAIEGQKPRLVMMKTGMHVADEIARLIKGYTEAGFRKNQIVILTLKTEQTSILGGLNSVGGYKLGNVWGGQDVLFASARRFKGLEADVVILVDFDADSFTTDESRKLFYVATSRAKHFLDIVGVVDEEGISNLTYMLDGEQRKNANVALATTLNVKMTLG